MPVLNTLVHRRDKNFIVFCPAAVVAGKVIH